MYPGYGGYPPPPYYMAPPPNPVAPSMDLKAARKFAKKMRRDADEIEKAVEAKLKDKKKDEKTANDNKTITKKETFTRFEVFSLLTLLSPIIGPAYIILIISLAKNIAASISSILH